MRLRFRTGFPKVRWGTVRRVYRRFGPYVLRYRRQLAAALLCLLGTILMTLAKPWPLKILFDHVIAPADGAARPLPFQLERLLPTSPTALVVAACLGVLAIAVLAGVFAYGQNLLTARTAHKVLFRIRADLFAHVQRLPLAFHSRRETGDLLLRMTGDIQMLREILVNSVITLTGRLLMIGGMVAVMAWMSVKLTLVAVSVIPLLLLILFRFSGNLREATRRQRRKEGRAATVISEAINAISVVKSFSRESFEDNRLATQNRGSLRAGLRATRIEESMARSAEGMVALGTCGVLAVGTHLVLRGQVSPGELLVFLSYIRSLYKPLRELSRLGARLSKASVCAERILDLMEPAIDERPGAVEAPCFSGEVELRDVNLRYEEGAEPAVVGLNLIIRRKETVLLLGPSGAGKTSIASLLLRLYDPTTGSVLIDGVDIRRYKLESLRQQIAVVLQDSILFGSTIAENIAYGKPEAGQDEIAEAARRVHAHSFIERLPGSYDAVIGERGVTLSGGQRQRIALARAAIKQASILILDEPTTGLDIASEHGVLEGMRSLMRDSTTFIISHRPTLFSEVDRVVVLDQGRVISVGPWDQVRGDYETFPRFANGAGR